jgi:3-hydroxyisobutyrate dehydrogenase-like beta-hydroxyacid dehydrogenase
MNIGIVGLGRMGSAIAQRLAENGFQVTAWDHNAAALRNQSGKTVRLVENARAVAEASETIISIITEDNGVRRLFIGRDGFLQADVKGKLFIEMSTLQPMTARELLTLVEQKGARMIDAPVLGSIPTVREGKLFVMAGGRPEDIEKARPVLDKLARHIMHMGPNGSGYAMKLAANIGLAAYIQAIAESLALGQRQGLQLEQMLEALCETATATPWLKGKLPALRGQKGDVSLDIKTLRKDIMSAVATGALTGVGLPLSSGALASLSAAVAQGFGDEDLAELPKFFRHHMGQSFE